MDRLVVAGQHDYDAAANWKILTENYHECYHCPMIHPELCKVSPPKSGENYSAPGTWVGGWMDLRDGMATMSLDGASHGAPLRNLDANGLRTVIYVNVFPNVLISLHPDYVMVHRLVPLAADRTRIECTWSFAPEAVARARVRPRLRDRVLGHHQPAGLAGVRVRPARADLAARGARPAVGRGRRGLPVRHHGRPRLPGPAGLEHRHHRAGELTTAGQGVMAMPDGEGPTGKWRLALFVAVLTATRNPGSLVASAPPRA